MALGRFKHLDDSASSSRSVSRSRTPLPESEENGQLDYNFANLEEILATRLEAYENMIDNQDKKQTVVNELNKQRITSTSTISEIIKSLSLSRSEVSSNSRELLLAQLYKLIITKPLVVYNEESGDFIDDGLVSDLIFILMKNESASAYEFSLLFRCVVSLIVSDIEEFGSLIDGEFLGYLKDLIIKPSNNIVTNENKSYIITGYVAMLLILHNGNGGFGIDDVVHWLFEVSEGFCLSSLSSIKGFKAGDREYSTFFDDLSEQRIVNDITLKQNTDTLVGVSGLHGVGCLISLLPRNDYLNDLIQDLMPKLIELLDEDNIEISKACGRLIGICYESYTYNNDEDEDEDEEFNYNAPYYEQEQLINTLNTLANLSTKKLKKNDKKDAHSIFRDVLNTVKNFSKLETRLEIYKKSPAGMELLNTMLDSNYLKLSRTRSIQINSWFLYLRLIHLKWCFGFGVHNQLVANESIRDILKEPPTDYQTKYGDDDEVIIEREYSTEKHEFDDKKRTTMVRKARVEKLTNNMEDLNL